MCVNGSVKRESIEILIIFAILCFVKLIKKPILNFINFSENTNDVQMFEENLWKFDADITSQTRMGFK